MIKIKDRLEKLVKQLGKKQTITPIKACNKIGIYKRRIVSDTLKKLHQEKVLIKRGPGEVYSLNPNLR